MAALLFRQDSRRLHLGLLLTDPWVNERPLVVALYSGAREVARRLGLREVRARTNHDETLLREAGYRRWGDGWRLEVSYDPPRRNVS